MEKIVSLGMSSTAIMSFAFTLLGNLEDAKVNNLQQRGFRFLKLLAEVKP